MMSDNEMMAVAWLRKNGFRFNGDIEPKDDSELPLYTRPALTDEQVREIREAAATRMSAGNAPDGKNPHSYAAGYNDAMQLIEAAIREAIGRGERG